MEFNLRIGMEAEVEALVDENSTAAKFGSGGIEVYATPMMVGLMENAALTAVDKELGEEYSTVGINVNVNHIAATPVGMKVKALAKLVKIEGKKLYFEVEAYDEKKQIGKGSHTRYIVDSKKFLERVKEL